MRIIQKADCLSLRSRLEMRLRRQSYYVFSFATGELDGPSFWANIYRLRDRFLAFLQAHPRTYRGSFSIWACPALRGWIGARSLCVWLYIGGCAQLGSLCETMQTWPGSVGMEGGDPWSDDAILLGAYEPAAEVLHLSAPVCMRFLPEYGNLEQRDSGLWVLTGINASLEGSWIIDYLSEPRFSRTFRGMDAISAYTDGAVAIKLDRLSDETASKLVDLRDRIDDGEELVRSFLSRGTCAADIERYIAQAELVYGDLHGGGIDDCM